MGVQGGMQPEGAGVHNVGEGILGARGPGVGSVCVSALESAVAGQFAVLGVRTCGDWPSAHSVRDAIMMQCWM